MSWVLVIGATWLVVALILALVIGRAVRLCDQRDDPRAKPMASRTIHMRGNTVHDVSPADTGPDEGRHPAVG